MDAILATAVWLVTALGMLRLWAYDFPP